MRCLGMAAALAVLAGCGSNERPVAAPSRGPTPKVAGSSAALPQPATKVIVDTDGVVLDPPGGKLAEFTFGSPRGPIEAAVTRLLGQAVNTANQECGAGPMQFARYGAVTLNYREGKFVGWTVTEGPGVVTSDGISVGKLLRDLKIARSARMIADSTLAGEFEYLAADGHPIGGFVSGAGRDAKIARLYAGTNCFFR